MKRKCSLEEQHRSETKVFISKAKTKVKPKISSQNQEKGQKMKIMKVFFIFVTLMLTSCYAKDREPLMNGGDEDESPLEAEYRRLYDHTDDKTGLESIRGLHKQLDDDNDGTIEPAETCDFIRADLVRNLNGLSFVITRF